MRRPYIQTVSGRIELEEVGRALPHEHVMVDFIGAEKTGPERYVRSAVVAAIAPFLKEAHGAGVETIFECTPKYLARDPFVLRELTERTGVRLVTNTGLYKEPYLPEYAVRESAEEIAERFVTEFEEGILYFPAGPGKGSTPRESGPEKVTDGTDNPVFPGFIKTAVHPELLAPVQTKIITAAAKASAKTGMTIATHTGVAVAAHAVLDLLEAAGVEPSRWIYVHAQVEADVKNVLDVARRGAWIELDGISPGTEAAHLERLLALLDAGFRDRLLLSQDSGWYRVGEPNGGAIRGYTHIRREFVPGMLRAGIDEETIRRITEKNPAEAYAIR